MTKKKKKSPSEFRDNNISRITAREKSKRLSGEKKKRLTLSHQLKKSRDTRSVGQMNENPPQNAAMLQSAQYQVEQNYKN